MTITQQLDALIGQEVIVLARPAGILRFDPEQAKYYLDIATEDHAPFGSDDVEAVEGQTIRFCGDYLHDYMQDIIAQDFAELPYEPDYNDEWLVATGPISREDWLEGGADPADYANVAD